MKNLKIPIIISFISFINYALLLNGMEKNQSLEYDPEYTMLYSRYKKTINNKDSCIREFTHEGLSQEEANKKYHKLLEMLSKELTTYRNQCNGSE